MQSWGILMIVKYLGNAYPLNMKNIFLNLLGKNAQSRQKLEW